MSQGRIFISYRRGVDNGEARSLYYQLERFFERDRLFMDVDDIPVGADFVEYLDGQVAQCNALIAVIGRGWCSHIQRLADDEDFVRIEIEAALKRGAEIPIIPLLIDGNTLPAREELPEVLHPLRRRNGVPIRHESYASTIEGRLIPALSKALHEDAPPERKLPLVGSAQTPAIRRPEFAKPEPFSPGTVFRDLDEPWCPEMVVIPTGSFMMGAPGDDLHGIHNEGPQHRVEIDQSFALARGCTTFDEYDAFCNAVGRERPKDEGWGRGKHPVINVSWQDSVDYCDWLSETSGHAYRLPSEAEWEYACRGGTDTRYTFGSRISTNLANFGEDRKGTVPAIFPSFEPNAFGLHQMHGNVWEWCADDWVESYENSRSQVAFTRSPRGDFRVARGGSWKSVPQGLRSTARLLQDPLQRNSSVGLRPARTPIRLK